MAVPSDLPSQSGVPNLILPSSMPNGYMSNPGSYGSDLPSVTTAESTPLPTSEAATSSTSEEIVSSTTSEMLPSTTGTVLPTDVTATPTPYVPTGTPGTAPDLVLPSTTANGFQTNTGNGSGDGQTSTPDSDQTTTLTSFNSVVYTTETSVTTISSSTSEEPSSIPPPTTVFVTVVVPTAPTATVTQTVYPSSISDVLETSQTTEVVSTTISYNTAIPGVTSGSAPELLTSTSATIATSIVSSEPALTSAALTAPALPTTTILQTFTTTNTENVVVTTFETITATVPDVIPIPTGADVITTVFETSSIVPPSARKSTKSPVPDFGNIISTSLPASYPPPLLPIPQNPGNVPITTTIQIHTSFAPVQLPSSVSAPFTYIASTIPYPTPNANAMNTQMPTTVQSGFIIPTNAILPPGKRSVGALPKVDARDASAALPTTLSTASVVKHQAVYTPTAAAGNIAGRSVMQPLEARSNAPRTVAPFAVALTAVVGVLIAIAM
ncbi:hypothetical protein TWF694_005688 [Orbilia ellipsospora]|uniref:Uncharacterized protein n=1 Tax=Orbilia ellipsospora TaxID=2528407 RepID=A0AAV9WRV0_9PEZI